MTMTTTKKIMIFLFVMIVFALLFLLVAIRRTELRQRALSDDTSLINSTDDGNTHSLPNEDEIIVETLKVDCGAGNTCQEITVHGDSKYTLPNGKQSPFGGYADPSVREDSNGVLWMAYSWPHLKFVNKKSVPSVDIHLAKSADKGSNWDFVTKLFTATPTSNPSKPSQSGYLDYEVVNLLPVEINEKAVWFGVTLNYFVPEQGGMAARPSDSFHIRVYQADTPTEISSSHMQCWAEAQPQKNGMLIKL